MVAELDLCGRHQASNNTAIVLEFDVCSRDAKQLDVMERR